MKTFGSRATLLTVLTCVTVMIFALAGTAGAQTTLRFLMESVPETFIIQDMLPEFEEQTGIKVEFESILYSDMHAKLIPQLLSAESQYHVLVVDNYWAGEFPAAGWLEPLEPYVEQSGFDLSAYIPSSLEMTGYYQGTLYMIPMWNYVMGLIYRTDIMEDPVVQARYQEITGQELAIPTTLEGYVELCTFMKEHAGIDGSAMQAQRGDPIVMEWTNYLYAMGGSYYDEDWNAVINDEQAVRATELYIELLENAAPIGALSFNLDDSFRVMAQGQAFSFITYYLLMYPHLLDPDQSTVDDRVAMALMPGEGSLNGGWGWAIPANLSQETKDAAWQFIEWVESPEIAKRRAMVGGSPTRYDMFNDPDVQAKFPEYTIILQAIEKARPVPEFEYSVQMIEVMGRELSLAASREKEIQAALDDAAAELDRLAVRAGLKVHKEP